MYKRQDYANAPLRQLEQDLRTIGLYRNKAKNVKAMAQKLIEDFDGVVPCNHEEMCIRDSLSGFILSYFGSEKHI